MHGVYWFQNISRFRQTFVFELHFSFLILLLSPTPSTSTHFERTRCDFFFFLRSLSLFFFLFQWLTNAKSQYVILRLMSNCFSVFFSCMYMNINICFGINCWSCSIRYCLSKNEISAHNMCRCILLYLVIYSYNDSGPICKKMLSNGIFLFFCSWILSIFQEKKASLHCHIE